MTDTTSTDTTAVDSASPVNASVYGTVIPVLFGSAQVLGAPMWAAPVIQNDDGSRIITAAYILGERDPQTTSVELIKVWINSLLAFASDGSATGGASGDSTFTFAFYDGSDDQLADPTIVAQEGAENTPAFRGRMYIVIQNLQVDSGAEFPEVTCEVTQHADFGNIRYVTPYSLVYGPMTGGDGFLVDKALGKLYAIDYSTSPQKVRLFDINVQQDEIQEYNTIPATMPLLCSGRYSPYLFGIINGRLGVQDWFGGVGQADVVSPYNGGIGVAQCSNYLYDGTQIVILTALTPCIQVYRFTQPLVLRFMHQENYDNIFNPNCRPAQFIPKAVSPNNDYVMAYVTAGRQVLLCMVTARDDTVTVGQRKVVYTSQDGFPGGKTFTDELTSPDTYATVLDLNVFLRDTMSEPNWATFIIAKIMVDPVAAQWVSMLVGDGLGVGGMYWLKFSTPFAGLGTVNPGHTNDAAGRPVPNPIPPLPALTDFTLINQQKYTFYAPSVGASAFSDQSQFDGQTKISFVTGTSQPCVFDMLTGAYTIYAHGTFINTRTSQDYGGSPNYDVGMVWNEPAKGFYYRNEQGGPPNPGFIRMTSNPTNKNALPLTQYLTSLALLGGFTMDQIVCTGFDATGCVGSIINQTTNFLDIVTTVCQLFNIDVIETGGVLKFSRRARGNNFMLDRTLTNADLAPVDQSNADDGTLITKIRDATKTVPNVIQTSYLDSDNDFQIGTQSARRTIYPVRTIFSPVNTQTIGVPLAMTAVIALYWTEVCLFDQWSQALQLTFRVSQAQLDLEPGDYIAINTLDDGNYIVKISEVDLNSDFSSNIIAYTVLAIPPDNQNLNDIAVASKDTGLLASALQSGQYNMFVCDTFNPTSAIGGETEANMYVYCDTAITAYLKKTDGTYWKGIVLQGAVTGVGLTALGVCPQWALSRPDTDTVLKIRMNGGSPLSAASDDAWRAGLCAIAIGSPGRWEVIYYRTCTANADGTYSLTNLIRGQRGTDATGANLGVGEGVVFISQSSPAPVGYTEFSNRVTQLIGNYSTRAPTDTLAKIQQVALSGGSVKPWAPVQVTATEDNSNNITITWNRRDRSDDTTAFGDEPDVPALSETLERYDVEINNTDGSVKRTYAGLTIPQCVYPAADVASDGLDLTKGLHVTVYQISQLVGRGYGRKALCLAN